MSFPAGASGFALTACVVAVARSLRPSKRMSRRWRRDRSCAELPHARPVFRALNGRDPVADRREASVPATFATPEKLAKTAGHPWTTADSAADS
jgi:hypothetical protein